MCKIVSLIILVSLISCFSYEKGDAAQELSGFSLVQYKEGGEKRWVLNGKSAEVEGDKVKIDEISAIAFGETIFKLKAKVGDFDRIKQLAHLENSVVLKSVDGTVLKTDSLYWNAEDKDAFTEEVVNIKKADFEVSGRGAVCDLEKRTAKLEKDVTANIKSSDPASLEIGSDKPCTVVTCSGPLEINYKKDKATFRNNVRIEDVQGDIFADRIDVYFSRGTRRIKCAVARGNVRIVNGDNITYSEKAIYLVDRGRVVLPKRPKLVIKNEPQD